jgi:hypothetical protein
MLETHPVLHSTSCCILPALLSAVRLPLPATPTPTSLLPMLLPLALAALCPRALRTCCA